MVAANMPSLSSGAQTHPARSLRLSELPRLLRHWLRYNVLYPCQSLFYSIFRGLSYTSGFDKIFNSSARQWDAFYHHFELRFRGDSKTIAERLRSRYHDRISALAANFAAHSPHTTHTALDLGCGSGEFLDLCRSVGFTTLGIDLSPPAIAACHAKGHHAYCKDILSYLRSLKDQSISVVGLFHVIEHCPPRYMLAVFREVSRVLVPRGMFIVETPSLYSLWSSVRQFYLDPTHLRPVHPEYISFLLDYCSLSHEETLTAAPVTHAERPSWQQLAGELPAATIAHFKKLDDWLYGPMDLAIVARR
jgi:O-antigen chain-terminating methyltransferase